jgi:uncharacterized repeat protein (TIGR01451 family)
MGAERSFVRGPVSTLGITLAAVALGLQGACGSSSNTAGPGAGTVDVAVGMTASAERVRAGETVTYQIGVTNAGPAAALPVGFTAWLTSHDDLRVTGSGWACQPHTGNFVTCELPRLSSGASSALSMSRRAVEPGRLENMVEVKATAQADSNMVNNRVTVVVQVE